MPEPLQGPRIIIRSPEIKKQMLTIQTWVLPLYPSVYPRSKTYLGPKASKYEAPLGRPAPVITHGIILSIYTFATASIGWV